MKFSLSTFPTPSFAGGVQKDTRLAELKERLMYAENLDRERKNELQSLRRRFEILIQALQVLQTQQQLRPDEGPVAARLDGGAGANVSVGANLSASLAQLLKLSAGGGGSLGDSSSSSSSSSNASAGAGPPIRLDPQFKLFLQNITDNAELQLPSFYSHMPHLSGKPESLVPAVKVSKARSGVSLVFGIPTVKRSVQSYLIGTKCGSGAPVSWEGLVLREFFKKICINKNLKTTIALREGTCLKVINYIHHLCSNDLSLKLALDAQNCQLCA